MNTVTSISFLCYTIIFQMSVLFRVFFQNITNIDSTIYMTGLCKKKMPKLLKNEFAFDFEKCLLGHMSL